MEQSVEKIIERNVLEVFNGRDATRQESAITETRAAKAIRA
jgi:hypothetical protein